MKKIVINLLIITLSLFIYLSFNGTKVHALSSDAYTIITNPGENASYEMNISWHADLDKTNSYCLYTKKTDTTWANAIKVMGKYEVSDCFDGNYSKNQSGDFYEQAKFLNYGVELTDLDSDTEYMYKVGQDVLSDVHYFKTAGDTSFSFAWISDFHAYTPIPSRKQKASQMMSILENYDNSIDFVLSTGDEIAWGGSYSFWKDLYNEEFYKKYMWASAIGNHDHMDRTSKKNSNEYFKVTHNFPLNGYAGEEGVCYYFLYSNVLFIFLNNETQASHIEEAKQWVRDVIASNPAQYIVVSEHYQWFNGISGASSLYSRWNDVFDECGVDLAISGNNHIYVRSKPLYNGKVTTSSKGTTYIQAPSSDNERGQDMKELSNNQNLIASRFTEGGKTMGGIVVKVSETGIKTELLDRNSNVIDTATIAPRRDVYPMDGFDKEQFEKDINVYTVSNNKAVLNFSKSGVGYIKQIEVKCNDEVYQTNFLKQKDTSILLDKLVLNDENSIDINITYKDETTKELVKKFIPSGLEKELTDIKVSIVDEKVNVEFTNNIKEKCDKINVYLNNNFVKEISNTSTNFILEEKIDQTSIIRIEAVKKNSVISFLETNYYSSSDMDCNGKSDSNDVEIIAKFIINASTKNTKLIDYYDLNNDGQVNIIDATYLAMYLDSPETITIEKKFKVIFINAYGKIIEEKSVEALEDVTPPDANVDGYTFISWDKDCKNITSNLTVTGIYVGE